MERGQVPEKIKGNRRKSKGIKEVEGDLKMKSFSSELAGVLGNIRGRRGKPVSEPPRSVLLLRTHAIGDVLLTTPAIRAVKKAWPQTHLTMVVGERCRPVLEGNPHVDSIRSFPEEWWFQKKVDKILRLTLDLRKHPKDGVILFHASPIIHLWGLLLNAPFLAGFEQNGNAPLLTHKAPLDMNSRRYLGDINLDPVRALGVADDGVALDFFLDPNELRAADRFLPAARELEGCRLVGVTPGGGRNALEQIRVKHWPVGHYVNLLADLSRTHRVLFVLLGDGRDTQVDDIAEGAARRGVKFINLKGKTTFRELAALIRRLDVLVTNDSSPLHVAVALGKPVVALFGPTANWSLCPEGAAGAVALQSPSPCSPCYNFGRFPGCPNPVCMAELSVEAAAGAVRALLA